MSPEDLARYREQLRHITDICELYEQDPDNYEAIYTKMQQVWLPLPGCGLFSHSVPRPAMLAVQYASCSEATLAALKESNAVAADEHVTVADASMRRSTR